MGQQTIIFIGGRISEIVLSLSLVFFSLWKVEKVSPANRQYLDTAIARTFFSVGVEGLEVSGSGIHRFEALAHRVDIVDKIHTVDPAL